MNHQATQELPKVMQQAFSRLLRKSPFLGLFLVRLPIQLDEGAGTAVTNGESIRIAPSFLRTLSLEYATGILAHEVYHVLLLHHIGQRRGTREPELWNQAADYVVNLILQDAGFQLPRGALLNARFRGISTEQVYALLQQSKPAASKAESGDGSGSGKQRDPGGLGRVEDAPESTPGQGGTRAHSALTTETAVQLAVQQARNHVRALGGHLPGAVERQIRWTYEEGRIDWTETLWRFVDTAACTAGGDWSWTRPSAWFLQQNIVLPTLVGEGLRRLPIVIDTSGSMTNEQIQAVQAELQSLLRDGRVEEVRVLYVDTRVRAEESFFDGQPVQLRPRGGGGTDFRAAFEQLDRNPTSVPAVVFFTDLLGVFPEEPPAYPTLWIHTWPGPPPEDVPFGEVIHMPR